MSAIRTQPQTRPAWLQVARIVWIALAIGALLMLATSLPGYLIRFGGQLAHVPADQLKQSDQVFAVLGGVASLASAMLSIGLAWLLYRQRFDKPLPVALSIYLLIYSIIMAGPLEHWASYWLNTAEFAVAVQGALLGIPTFALLALFPDGRFVPSWMRWVLYLSIPWGISFIFIPELTTTNFNRYPLLISMYAVGFLITMAFGIYAQIYRYKRVSTPDQRQQTKWVVFGFGIWIAYMLISSAPYFYLDSLPADQPVPWWTGLSELGWWLSLNIMPIALTIATTRYRLWNVDRVINRTLVYSALTASIIAIYVLIVGGLGLLFQSSNSRLVPLFATGLAAVLFQPLRARMQGTVNRMMYGDRDDPTAVLSKLGDELEKTGAPEHTLTAIVQTIAQALKLPYVAIEIGDQREAVVSYGVPDENADSLPLTYQTQNVGRLLVAPRAQGEPLSVKDHQLLENIAHQAGAVVYNAHLTADLLRTRERLVTSREEERRRIRRDLHDGLGPELASLTLKLDAARNLLASDATAAEQLLAESKQQSQDAIAEIRGLVYNLRPPALDELGLLPAIREHVDSFPPGQRPQVHVRGPEQLPTLPAAVEVAAYRIVHEGINNARKHSEANNCWVEIELKDSLAIRISDDGKGLPADFQAGVGITSMRERTAELGGKLLVSSGQSSGTTIVATFPIPEPES